MNAFDICLQIFKIALPFSKKSTSPISYINIEVAEDLSVTDEDLWNVFNKLRWDSDLSSAELFITRIPQIQNLPQIKVVSLSLFEDDQGDTPQIQVNQPVSNL